MQEHIKVVGKTHAQDTQGCAGLRGQLPGKATTIGNVSEATGGIGNGNLLEADIR